MGTMFTGHFTQTMRAQSWLDTMSDITVRLTGHTLFFSLRCSLLSLSLSPNSLSDGGLWKQHGSKTSSTATRKYITPADIFHRTEPMDQSEMSHHWVEHTSSIAVKIPLTQLPTQFTSMQLACRFSWVSLNTTGRLLILQLVGCSIQVSLNTAGRVCY